MNGQEEQQGEVLKQLRMQLSAARDQIAALQAQVAKHEQELKGQAGSISRIETQIHYILTARVWRGLQFAGRLASRFLPEKSRTPWAPTEKEYQTWIAAFDGADRQQVLAALPTLVRRPKISIVVPVFNTDSLVLEATIRSVQAQKYDNWELCIADDRSTRSSVIEVLKRFAAEDDRIKVVFRSEQGGISQGTNSALAIVTGEYVAFLDHDDVLTDHALAAVCQAINAHPEAGLIYSDEDKLDNRGKRYHPVFKSDWSPDLLHSSNYICHFTVVKRSLQQAVGPLRSEFDGSQDYDFLLRVAAQKPEVVHIPKILYHWRAVPGSTAGGLDSKSYAVDAARNALTETCAQRGDGSKVEPAGVTGWWRIRYPFAEGTTASIIVDATGSVAKVRATLDSLLEKTGHRSFEILVVPRSPELDIPSLQEDFKHSQNGIRFLPAQLTLTWANAMNAAAREARSSALIFLRSPSIVLSSDWLGALLEHAMRAEVGAVGGKILAGNGTIASAGLVLGVKGLIADAFAGLQGSTPHYFGLSNVVRNISALSARCLGTSSAAFKALGGFDEENFPSELAAPDYCLRAGQAGLRTVYSPYALLQQESGDAVAAGKHPESERFRSRWVEQIANDPYYNINLTRTRTDYTLRQKSK